VIGPLTGADGITFSYYDSAGAVTIVPTQVAQIEIVLRARTVVAGFGVAVAARRTTRWTVS